MNNDTDFYANHKEIKRIFATRLKELRLEKDLTQEDLSEILNITRNHLSNIENMRSGVTVGFLCDAAKFFNCSTDYLVGFSNTKKYLNHKTTDVYEFIRDYEVKFGDFKVLDEKDKEIIINSIEYLIKIIKFYSREVS